jgi:hypothetical protein
MTDGIRLLDKKLIAHGQEIQSQAWARELVISYPLFRIQHSESSLADMSDVSNSY